MSLIAWNLILLGFSHVRSSSPIILVESHIPKIYLIQKRMNIVMLNYYLKKTTLHLFLVTAHLLLSYHKNKLR